MNAHFDLVSSLRNSLLQFEGFVIVQPRLSCGHVESAPKCLTHDHTIKERGERAQSILKYCYYSQSLK